MFNIRGLPQYIQIVQRGEFRLNICTRSHFACTCENDTLCAGTELCVHFITLFLRFSVTCGADFVFGNTTANKFFLDIIINGETSVAGIDGYITEYSRFRNETCRFAVRQE